MAKDKYASTAFGGAAVVTATAEETETVPEAQPDATPTPAVAPAPATEATPEEITEEPAAARTTLADIMSLAFDSPEAKRVLDQIRGMSKLCEAFRTSIHNMIAVENKNGKMTLGQQIFFSSVSHGTFDIQGLFRTTEGALVGQVTLDNEGEVVVSSEPKPFVPTME